MYRYVAKVRRFFAVIYFICVALLMDGASPFAFPSSDGASVGVFMVRLRDGAEIAAYDADRLLVPASVTKCLTAATAQLSLPADFSFVTALQRVGDISARGILEGDLRIVGGYDPTLGSRFFDDRESFASWALRVLSDVGMEKIGGKVCTYPEDQPLDALSPYWLLEDIDWEYGAGCYPLNYKDNSYPGSDGRVADVDPAATLCDELCARLKGAGIEVMDEDIELPSDSLVVAVGDILGEYHSPLRDEILRVMMHRSDNLYAEAMLRAPLLASMPVGSITAKKALAAQADVWKARGVDLAKGRVTDGSGLAPVNRLSARLLCSVLRSMARSREYVGLFPIAAREGTVKSFLRGTPLAGRMAVKSGSMTGVLCYAGYLLDSHGSPTHVVVVMVNGFTCPSSSVRSAIEKYLRNKLP